MHSKTRENCHSVPNLNTSQKQLLQRIANSPYAHRADQRSYNTVQVLRDAGLITANPDEGGVTYGPMGGKKIHALKWVCQLTDTGREALS
jgi:hypothetical protein